MSLTPAIRAQLAALHGLVSEDLGLELSTLAASVPRQYAIVELGSFCGKSTCYLAAGSMSGGGAPVFAVDPWYTPGNASGRFGFSDPATFDRFRRQVRACGFEHTITAFRCFSIDIARFWTRPIGLLYVDGSHLENDVRRDWQAWSPHLADHAIVAFDDYQTPRNPGVAKVVDGEIRKRPDFRWRKGPEPLIVGIR